LPFRRNKIEGRQALSAVTLHCEGWEAGWSKDSEQCPGESGCIWYIYIYVYVYRKSTVLHL